MYILLADVKYIKTQVRVYHPVLVIDSFVINN